MKSNIQFNLRKLFRSESGQTAIIALVSMTTVVGMGGIAIESGHGYYAYQQLIASTNAAALAGAQGMPNQSTAGTNALAYSAETGKLNASPLLTNVVATPSYPCLTSTSITAPCETSSGASGSGSANAVKVTQTADVPSWFAGMFGIHTFHLSYTSMAEWSGGSDSPWNIAIILDGTASMGSSDGGTQCSGTREACALQGLQALLVDLYPCALGQTCTSSTSYVDQVSLFVFPPPSTATAPYDYCSGGSPSSITNGSYVVPTLTSTYNYQVVAFTTNYKTKDTDTTLNTSSNLAKASGYTGTSCAGVYPKGGAGTYYAQVISTAQAALVAAKTLNPISKNAMIILSDGDATACATSANTSAGGCTSAANLSPSTTNSLNGLTTHNSTTTTYPSAIGECGQAVLAAQAATQAGTAVYTIGYGSPITSSCTADQTYTSSGNTTYGGAAWPAASHKAGTGTDAGKQACDALAAMASNQGDFYSDGTGKASTSDCVALSPTNAAFTSLTSIFHSITANMQKPRLVPANTN